jgi:hypothetical protein
MDACMTQRTYEVLFHALGMLDDFIQFGFEYSEIEDARAELEQLKAEEQFEQSEVET